MLSRTPTHVHCEYLHARILFAGRLDGQQSSSSSHWSYRESCRINPGVHNGAMGIVNRIMMVVMLAVLLQAGAGTFVLASAHSSKPLSGHALALRALEAGQPSVALGTGRIVQNNEPTSAADCVNGLCGGITCQCPCHGLMAAFVALPITFPDLPIALEPPSPPSGSKAISLIPPVRPPKI